MLSKKGSGKRKVDLPSYYWPNRRSGIGSITASFSGRVLWKDQHHTVSRKEPNDASRWSSKVRYFAKTLESVFSLCVRLPTRSEGGSATKTILEFPNLNFNLFSQEENRET